MKFHQIKGNTWALEGLETIPVYRIDQKRCILFDTGMPSEKKKLEEAFEENGLEIVAIICSHCHIDHVGLAQYFHEKFQIPLYISQEEEAILCCAYNVKLYRPYLTPKEIFQGDDLVCTTATTIPVGCQSLEICGVTIKIEPTTGHSSGQLAFITPDDVCYLADALLSEEMYSSKLPYAIDVAEVLACHLRILDFPYSHYILSHRGDFPREELSTVVEGNRNLFFTRAKEIKSAIGQGKNLEQLTLEFCRVSGLNTRKAKRMLMYQRTIRYFLEYLEDLGEIELYMCQEHGIMYRLK